MRRSLLAVVLLCCFANVADGGVGDYTPGRGYYYRAGAPTFREYWINPAATPTPAGSVWAVWYDDDGYITGGWLTASFAASIGVPDGLIPNNWAGLGNYPGTSTPVERWLAANISKLWDLNDDGLINADDYDRFVTDIDDDGIPNDEDTDKDGDGELDVVENHINEAGEVPASMDWNQFVDRDEDGLPDMADSDGDGWPNWLESFPKEDGMGTISDPNDAMSHPPGSSSNLEDWYPLLSSKNPDYPGTAFQGPNPFGDDDGDGAWNFLELITPTPQDDNTWYPDGNEDGIWDWWLPMGGGSIGVIPGDPDPDPDPDPTPPPPLVNPPPSSGMPGGAPNPSLPTGGGPAPSTGPVLIAPPSPSGTANYTYVDNSNSTQMNNIGGGDFEYKNSSGTTYNVNVAPGVGSSGTTQGEGDYVVIDIPKGVSTNWQGAGGGTWKQRQGPRQGEALEGQAESVAEGINKLGGPKFGGAGGDGHSYGAATGEVVSFTLTIPGLGERTYTITVLPDTSTWYGAILEPCRLFLLFAIKVLASWYTFQKIWLALRQSW